VHRKRKNKESCSPLGDQTQKVWGRIPGGENSKGLKGEVPRIVEETALRLHKQSKEKEQKNQKRHEPEGKKLTSKKNEGGNRKADKGGGRDSRFTEKKNKIEGETKGGLEINRGGEREPGRKGGRERKGEQRSHTPISLTTKGE